MDIVSNVKIYDLEESLLASGYPMRTNTDPREITEKDLKDVVVNMILNEINIMMDETK